MQANLSGGGELASGRGDGGPSRVPALLGLVLSYAGDMAGSGRFVLVRRSDGICAAQRCWWGLRWCSVISAEGSSTSSPGRAQHPERERVVGWGCGGGGGALACAMWTKGYSGTVCLHNICIVHPVKSRATAVMGSVTTTNLDLWWGRIKLENHWICPWLTTSQVFSISGLPIIPMTNFKPQLKSMIKLSEKRFNFLFKWKVHFHPRFHVSTVSYAIGKIHLKKEFTYFIPMISGM